MLGRCPKQVLLQLSKSALALSFECDRALCSRDAAFDLTTQLDYKLCCNFYHHHLVVVEEERHHDEDVDVEQWPLGSRSILREHTPSLVRSRIAAN